MRFLPPLPPELEHEPFSVAEAARAGVHAARLRRADLRAPFRGVRTTVDPRPGVGRALAYAPNLRDGQAFSHVSAALLWGMWLPRRLENASDVDVLSIQPRDRPQAAGVRGHRAAHESITFARGLPVVSAVRTWVHLAPLLSLDELIAMGDGLLRRNNPLATHAELVTAVRPGERGAALVRRAIPSLRSRADSPKETELRLVLARAGLPEPEVNGEISLSTDVSTPGDLVFREWKVLAEYDGQQHRTSRRQFERDIVRLEALVRAGWAVIRVLDVHLLDPLSIVMRVATALRDNGWRGRLSRGEFLRNVRDHR